MTRKITDLESIIDPISVLFRRARETDNLDVLAPNNMLFSSNNTITLVWNLTNHAPIDSVSEFSGIKNLAQTSFQETIHEDLGIVTYEGKVVWHGEYPDVFFRVILPVEVTRCPSTGDQSVSS